MNSEFGSPFILALPNCLSRIPTVRRALVASWLLVLVGSGEISRLLS